ncbi:MAG: hypothetical protein JNM25_02930 [Planctomycetes bacterium]|nr:hypothetical protein [Planctomycetota bacterium]
MDLTHSLRAPRAAALFLGSVLAPLAAAQTGCSGFGSTPVPASITDSPLPLDCRGAPAAPQWRLFTPGHREPAPHAGHDPGDAHALPRLIVRYRCTGLLLLPVVPVGIRTMGYVIDQPEHACAAISP